MANLIGYGLDLGRKSNPSVLCGVVGMPFNSFHVFFYREFPLGFPWNVLAYEVTSQVGRYPLVYDATGVGDAFSIKIGTPILISSSSTSKSISHEDLFEPLVYLLNSGKLTIDQKYRSELEPPLQNISRKGLKNGRYRIKGKKDDGVFALAFAIRAAGYSKRSRSGRDVSFQSVGHMVS